MPSAENRSPSLAERLREAGLQEYLSAFGAVDALAQLLSRWLGDRGLSRERATLQRFGEELGREVLAVALAADFIHEAGFSGFPLYDANGYAGPDAEVHALLLALHRELGWSDLPGGARVEQALAGYRPGLSHEALTALDDTLGGIETFRDGLEQWTRTRFALKVPEKEAAERFAQAQQLAREEVDKAPTLTVPLHMIESVNTLLELRRSLGRLPTLEEFAQARGRAPEELATKFPKIVEVAVAWKPE